MKVIEKERQMIRETAIKTAQKTINPELPRSMRLENFPVT
jgi:hypothetical protein